MLSHRNPRASTACFRLATITSLIVSATPANSIAAITFTNAETHSFTITVNPTVTLPLSGTGITNNSGITQNFVTAVDGAGNGGLILFNNSATAGSMTSFTNNGATVFGGIGGVTQFINTSTADHGTFTDNGGAVVGANGGDTEFVNTSKADHGTFINNGGAVVGGGGG